MVQLRSTVSSVAQDLRPGLTLTPAYLLLPFAGTKACDVQIQGVDKVAPLLVGGMDGVYKLLTCVNGRPMYKRDAQDAKGERSFVYYPVHESRSSAQSIVTVCISLISLQLYAQQPVFRHSTRLQLSQDTSSAGSIHLWPKIMGDKEDLALAHTYTTFAGWLQLPTIHVWQLVAIMPSL